MKDVYGYDEYNDSIAEELHHSLRAGTRQSVGVVHPLPEGVLLFEPMSMREENWAESNVKNALRAGASKSSHAVVCEAVETEEPQTDERHVQMLNFQGSKGNTVVSEDGQSFTLNAMHGHDMHVIAYSIMGAPPREPDRPNGGYYINETQVMQTLDAFSGGLNPVVNQGGLAIVTESWPIAFRGRDGGMTAEQGEEGLANTIRAGQGGSVRPHVLTRETVSDNLNEEQGEYDMDASTSLVVRRLTPQECELLMGWDSGWTEVGVTDKGELVQMADTHRYRMCGNGVVANVAEWLGVRYLAAKSAIGEDPKDSW